MSQGKEVNMHISDVALKGTGTRDYNWLKVVWYDEDG
jgi:hypothetical protein